MDYVDKNNTKWVDKSGHGTAVTSILLQIVKFAKIYIARVFETTNAVGKPQNELLM